MHIEKLLAKYTELAAERDETYEALTLLDNKINTLVYENETPIELFDIDGNPTGVGITTPDDLWNIRYGTIIDVYGVKWMGCETKWINCYGHGHDDAKMFIYILRNRDYVHLIHKGY